MWPCQLPQVQQATTGRWGAQASGFPLPCNSAEGLRVTPSPTIAVAIASVAAQAPSSVLPMQQLACDSVSNEGSCVCKHTGWHTQAPSYPSAK